MFMKVLNVEPLNETFTVCNVKVLDVDGQEFEFLSVGKYNLKFIEAINYVIEISGEYEHEEDSFSVERIRYANELEIKKFNAKIQSLKNL